MTDPFYRAEPDAAPEDASIRYSVIAGILYLVIVAVVALIAGHNSAQVVTTDSNPPAAAPSTAPTNPTTAPK
jgi:hypothetical protein